MVEHIHKICAAAAHTIVGLFVCFREGKYWAFFPSKHSLTDFEKLCKVSSDNFLFVFRTVYQFFQSNDFRVIFIIRDRDPG